MGGVRQLLGAFFASHVTEGWAHESLSYHATDDSPNKQDAASVISFRFFFDCAVDAVMQEINCKGTSKNGCLLQIRRRTMPSFGNLTMVEPRSGSSRVVSSQNGKPPSPSYGSTGSVCFKTLSVYVVLIALVS
jgi:hypothetical protein